MTLKTASKADTARDVLSSVWRKRCHGWINIHRHTYQTHPITDTQKNIFTQSCPRRCICWNTHISPQSTHANTQANMYTEVGMVRMEFKLAVWFLLSLSFLPQLRYLKIWVYDSGSESGIKRQQSVCFVQGNDRNTIAVGKTLHFPQSWKTK